MVFSYLLSQQRVVQFSVFVKPDHIPCSFPIVPKVPSLGPGMVIQFLNSTTMSMLYVVIAASNSLQIIHCDLDEGDDGV